MMVRASEPPTKYRLLDPFLDFEGAWDMLGHK